MAYFNEIFYMYARLVNYPNEDIYTLADECIAMITASYPENTEDVLSFCNELKKLPLDKLEEFYVGTFDVNPICSLEIGWQISGEQYNRGEFLTEMRVALHEYGIPDKTELPDLVWLSARKHWHMDNLLDVLHGTVPRLPVVDALGHSKNAARGDAQISYVDGCSRV